MCSPAWFRLSPGQDHHENKLAMRVLQLLVYKRVLLTGSQPMVNTSASSVFKLLVSPLPLDKLYDGLRAEAALHAKLRAESFQKAAMARSKKQAEVAQYYAQQVLKECIIRSIVFIMSLQGHLHTEKMREANRRAAEATFRLKSVLLVL